MRIAVTGASGFLGQHLLIALKQEFSEAKIIGVVRSKPREPVPNIQYVEKLCKADLLFHLAGSKGIAASLDDPVTDLEENAGFTLQVLEMPADYGEAHQ